MAWMTRKQLLAFYDKSLAEQGWLVMPRRSEWFPIYVRDQKTIKLFLRDESSGRRVVMAGMHGKDGPNSWSNLQYKDAIKGALRSLLRNTVPTAMAGKSAAATRICFDRSLRTRDAKYPENRCCITAKKAIRSIW